MTSSRCVPRVVLVLLCAGAAACDGKPVGDPLDAYAQFSAGGPILLQCATGSGSSFSATVGAAGATFTGEHVQVVIPPGALADDTRFHVTVPASPFVEIDVTANGQEHFRFLKPVSITLDYSRCARVPSSQLTVWYVDGATKTLLEDMGGVDDRARRRITFSTVHLSGYAIAN